MPNPSIPMPVKAKPYAHQYKAFEFACTKFGILPGEFSSGVALLMEMGTGKTITSIGIAGALYQFGKIKRVLVVAPLSILGVWEEEFSRFADYPYTLTVLKHSVASVETACKSWWSITRVLGELKRTFSPLMPISLLLTKHTS